MHGLRPARVQTECGTPEDNAVVEEAEDDADEAEKNRLFGFSCPDLSDPFYEVLKESVAVSLDGQGDRIMVRDAQCDRRLRRPRSRK